MANTAWSASDKTASITLSGSNLIATCNSSVFGGVRAADRQVTGKHYWEYTFNSVSGSTGGAGVLSPTYALNNSSGWLAAAIGACGLAFGGLVAVDGSTSNLTVGGTAGSTVNFGTITNGTVVCVAADGGGRLIWFRLGAAGNWNALAGRDPATGTGGISTGYLGIAIPICPAVLLSTNTNQITANFGDTAFTGTAPSGFTSGFTAGVSIPNSALATQVAIEEWASVATVTAPTRPPQFAVTVIT